MFIILRPFMFRQSTVEDPPPKRVLLFRLLFHYIRNAVALCVLLGIATCGNDQLAE